MFNEPVKNFKKEIARFISITSRYLSTSHNPSWYDQSSSCGESHTVLGTAGPVRPESCQ